MRAFAAAFLFALIAAAGAQAQHHHRGGGVVIQAGPPGVVPFRTYGSPTGFGNILFPGTGTAPPLTNPFAPGASFAERFGATVGGWPAFNGAPVGRRGGFHRGGFGQGGGTVVYPVPVYVGDPYGYGYAEQQQAPPNVTIVMPPQQAAPPVAINQYFPEQGAQPIMHEYNERGEETTRNENPPVRSYVAPGAQPAAAPAGEETPLFLIALNDSTVYTAVAYWVEGNTLHYMTPKGRHNQVSLDLVDRDTSNRLNKGRQVEFRLPPPTK